MISFKNVTKTYDTNIALKDVSIDIAQGEFVFLVGPSGAGKSTFIKLLLHEIVPDEGSIMVQKKEVTKLPSRLIPIHRRNLGIVFQNFRLLPKKTVFENVAFAMEILHKSKKEIAVAVPQVLSLVGISNMAKKYPSELSAGEQQRVAIARALLNDPDLILADEPTGNLDPETSVEIMKVMREINDSGRSILMATHDYALILKFPSKTIKCDAGKLFEVVQRTV